MKKNPAGRLESCVVMAGGGFRGAIGFLGSVGTLGGSSGRCFPVPVPQDEGASSPGVLFREGFFVLRSDALER